MTEFLMESLRRDDETLAITIQKPTPHKLVLLQDSAWQEAAFIIK